MQPPSCDCSNDAANKGHLECAKVLRPLEKGMEDDGGWNASLFAAEYGHLDRVEFLAPEEAGMQDGRGRTATRNSTEDGRTTSVLPPSEAGIANDCRQN